MSRSRTGLAAAVVLLAALLSPTGGSQAVPGTPSIYFDPDEIGWQAYRDQSPTIFRLTSTLLRAAYLPVDLEVDRSGSRIGTVWQANPGGRQWSLERDLTSAEYGDYWQQQREAGFRVVEQETYRKDGQQLWAGIWMREDGDHAWRSTRGMTTAQVDDRMEQARADGLMPVDIDQYATANGRRWAVVWASASSSDWTFVRDLTKAQFGEAFQDNAGKRVLTFESVELAGVQRYAGVFVPVTNGRLFAFRRDMSATYFDNWTHRYADRGYRVVGLDRYETAAGTRYAVMWRQNTDRPTWSLKSAVDDLVTTEHGKGEDRPGANAPGLAVAVYVGGEPVYLRGVGIADEAGHWMDSTHVGSIASVSKAVAGVLTFRMQELDELDVDDTTRGWVPTMPGRHTHTLGQLLSNRGCIAHYGDKRPDGDPVIDRDFEGDSYPTALSAAREFWGSPMVCNPLAAPVDHYSTYGYTLLGAALEAAGDDDWKSLVRERLVEPYDLGTLGPQRNGAHRMGLWGGGEWIDRPDNDWKVLGGGIDSSAQDLAAFGAKVADNSILTSQSTSDMWTVPDTSIDVNGNVSTYAFGWVVRSLGGQQVIEKSGKWAGSRAMLWMHPGYDVVVAVIANAETGGSVPLARDIGQTIVSSVVP